MDKKELRRKYIELRKNILDKEYKSNLIINKVLEDIYFKKSKVIAIYVNTPYEVFTEELIKKSLNLNKIVAVPKVVDKTEMKFYGIKTLDDLVSINNFNIKEPIENVDNLVLPNQINLFIVPGICFDMNKNRIGYGGGYYDKYLIECPTSYKIGLAFNEQILYNAYIENDENDIKLDEIITDKILIK